MDGPTAFEDEVAAILDLANRMDAPQAAAGQTFLGGELWPQNQGPMLDALLEELSTEGVGRILKGFGIADGNEAVIVLAEWDPLAEEFSLDEIVAIKIGGDVERAEKSPRGAPWDRRSDRECRSNSGCRGCVACARFDNWDPGSGIWESEWRRSVLAPCSSK